jgi:hypothetical protein
VHYQHDYFDKFILVSFILPLSLSRINGSGLQMAKIFKVTRLVISLMSNYPDNPGPLPATKLCNDSPPYNPIKGDGALGNQYRGRMFYKGNDREELVKTLQMMLKMLGYDLGTFGPNKDGVDGKFGDDTEKAVKQFQENNKDWDGNDLKDDGLVGPRTSDALNRAMVGLWYEHYQTPKELVEEKPYHTVTSDFLTNGLAIEPYKANKAKVFVKGPLPQGYLSHISVLLHSNSGAVPLSDCAYRIYINESRILEGKTDKDGFVYHPNVPPGDYRMEIEGLEGDILVPTQPTHIARRITRVPGYFLFEDSPKKEYMNNE